MDLLTGATGFLGTALAARLGRGGRRLRALVRPGTDLRRIPPEISEVVWGDLSDPEAVDRAVAGVEVIFHAAARVSSGGNRAVFEAENVRTTAALLDAARRARVRRFVHVGSAGIYGAGMAGVAITEQTPIDSEIEKRGAYAWSKAESDRVVQEYGRSGKLETVIVRPGLLYGPGMKPFMARLALPAPFGRRLIVGSPQTLLPFTHVANAAEAIALAAERGESGAAYNVIDGETSQGEYLQLLRDHGLTKVQPTYVPPALFTPVALGCEWAGRLMRRSLPLSRYKLKRATESLRYDTSAAREQLGWSPAVGLAEGVRSMATAAR